MRKTRYQFLSRKERQAIDFINKRLLFEPLESGDVATFNTIIGVLQDLKDIAGRVSADQEKCLRLPLVLFEAAMSARGVIKVNGKLD